MWLQNRFLIFREKIPDDEATTIVVPNLHRIDTARIDIAGINMSYEEHEDEMFYVYVI